MKQRRKRFLESLGMLAIATAMIMVMLWGGYTLYESSRWDPLGEYPVQSVTPFPTKGGVRIIEPDDKVTIESSDNSTSTSVSFYLDQDIHSSGVKCVKSGEDVVQIKGTLYWQSDQPPGRILKVADGSSDRGPGCQQYDFSNPIPEQVLAEVARLSAKGYTQSEWHLTGTEIPIKKDGTEGVSRTWITTSFTLIHENAPTL